MLLSVKNLGPIKAGIINLDKSLTILTGPNNTGKSYLTYLFHGISQHSALTNIDSFRLKIINLLSSKDAINQAIDKGEEIELSSFFSEIIPDIFEIISADTHDNLSKIFASTSINAELSINSNPIHFSNKPTYIKAFSVFENTLNIITHDGNSVKREIYKRHKDVREFLLDSLYVYALMLFDKALFKKTFFFPAERTAINMFAKHITSIKAEIKDDLDFEVINGLTDNELVQRFRSQVKKAPKYPYAIRDYISFVNNFKKDEEGKFAKIATNIEIALTGGKVHVDEFNQLIFTPSESNLPLELHLSSSLVKSLSYLILYLRYKAEKGDQIIIDEPELNLHPDLQIALAKIIAEMVNAGLKVIISTHSDYLIKELNNLILLGELNKQEEHKVFVAKKGFTEQELLTRKQVRAYFLHSGPEGSNIQHIDLEENGLVVPTINDAIRRVDGLAEEVFMEMED